MLDLHGQSVFAHSVASFERYFASSTFLFVLRDVHGTESFVRSECARLGIAHAETVVLDTPTRGQAETVAVGLRRAGAAIGEPLTIFNIDTFRPGFTYPASFDLTAIDGYLEVFRGEGANWSYVRPVTSGCDRVAQTTEKLPISDLCCTGLYHFGSTGAFLNTYDEFAVCGMRRFGVKELFVAPMYNLLIEKGADIRYHVIPDGGVVFCGVPAEYEALHASVSASID
jgi:hypothetical protein